MSSRERLSAQHQSSMAAPAAPQSGFGPYAIPRLSLPPTTAARPGADAPAIDEAEIDRFVACVRGAEDDRASAHVRALVERGVAVEAVYLELLAPAARRLGAMWDDDTCDFVEVTVALGRLQRILHDVRHLFVGRETQPNAGRVLLSCIPGEQHSLGLFMVSEFFVRDGWEVCLGSPISDCDIATLLRDDWYDVVGFSVACNSRLSYLSREIPRLRKFSRNRRITVLVGGRVFSDDPAMVNRVRADAACTDAGSAPSLARRLVSGRRGSSALPLARRAER